MIISDAANVLQMIAGCSVLGCGFIVTLMLKGRKSELAVRGYKIDGI